MREGIPKWPPYTHEKKEFMAINKYWSVKNDYSLVSIDWWKQQHQFGLINGEFSSQYYTVTVDKAGPRAVDPETAKECANAYWKSKKERRH